MRWRTTFTAATTSTIVVAGAVAAALSPAADNFEDGSN